MKSDSIQSLWLIGIATLLFCGCSLTSPVATDEQNQTTPQSERAPSSEIWMALARAVDARTIDSTTRLAQFVIVLARNGDLTAEDTGAFDREFPQAVQDGRPLNAADSKSLVQLANHSQ